MTLYFYTGLNHSSSQCQPSGQACYMPVIIQACSCISKFSLVTFTQTIQQLQLVLGFGVSMLRFVSRFELGMMTS